MKRKQRRNAERRRSIETRASVGLHHRIIHRALSVSRARRPRRSRAFLVMLSLRCAGGSRRTVHTLPSDRVWFAPSRSGPGAGVGDGDASLSGATRRRNGSSRREPAVTFAFPAAALGGGEGRARPGGSGSLGAFAIFSREEDRRLLERSEPTGGAAEVVARATRAATSSAAHYLSILSVATRPSAW